ncbi:PH domain-containing protein [Bifidobacterium simiarum]|uniref:PH domain-containing protein n=1 Tax=Bifidobacterium simiarum TaxID=2045441 RepID=UPI001BDCC918|nr:PH domain-containing protein [Bifidobacterium simiarum]MBT1165742.1 PH domain-containing protein [Bifidobacterium simiarum]
MRVHPLSLIIDITERARSMVGTMVSLLVLVAWMHPSRQVVWTVIALAVAGMAVWQIALWACRRYRLGDDEITLVTGVFNTIRTTIPYDHIHTVNVSQPFFFKPFGLVSVTIDAGGTSGGSAIVLTAVPAGLGDKLERLRLQTMDAAAGRPTPTADGIGPTDHGETRLPDTDHNDGRLVFRASVRDTILFALTDLGFLAALAVIYGFAQNLRDLLPAGMVYRAEYAVYRFAAGSVITAIMVAAAILASMLVVSVVKSLLLFHRFEVWRRGDDLIIVRGLITRRSITIPVRRVQAITIRQSVLRRALHLSSVQVGLATPGTDSDGDDDDTRGSILPVIEDGRLYATLHDMLPEWDLRGSGRHGDLRGESHGPQPVRVKRTARGLGRYLLVMPPVWTAAVTAVMTVGVLMIARYYAPSPDTPLDEVRFPDGHPVFEPYFHVLWLLWLLTVPLLAGGYVFAKRWLKLRAEGYALLDDGRIVVTGARRLSFVTMITRRSRIQCVQRRIYPWRVRAGVESLDMPLFVMNGYSWLRFTVIRSPEAQRLHDWAMGIGATE